MRQTAVTALVSLALLAGASRSVADVSIQGALSNFDCPNETGQVCDEFEIELHNVHPEDIYGFWGNFNYGMPTMTPLPDGTGVLINYRRAGRSTALHATEHFGIHMQKFGLISSRVFRWKLNGEVVTAGPGAGAWPVPIPTFTVVPPAAEAENEAPELAEAIENELPDQTIWVRRSVYLVQGAVTLGQLMPDDPIITAATAIDSTMQRLEPHERLENLEPLEAEHLGPGVRSRIVIIETYADVVTGTGASAQHTPGVLVSRVMNAAVTESTPCDQRAVFTEQPQSLTVEEGGTANLTIAATVPAGVHDEVYQWAKDGVPITGEDGTTLQIEPVTLTDAGQYTLTITNDCGTATSAAATLTVTPQPTQVPACGDADVGRQGGRRGSDGALDNNDFIAFIDYFFDESQHADLGRQGGLPGRDHVFDNNDFIVFVSDFFGGCN